MKHTLLGAVELLGSWTAGLILAALTVPGVSVSPWGFILAAAIFTVAQAITMVWFARLPHGYASLLVGGSGLVWTVVALLVAAGAGGLHVAGFSPWAATTAVVWLVTTIGAILLPEVYGPRPATESVPTRR